jgi:hypothetical protein
LNKFLICLMGILLIAIALSAATADTAVSFSVDTAHPGAPLSRVLLDSFGSSHGSTTLRATWRSHFSQTLRDIPFRRVRFHGILDDDMSSFRAQDGNGGFSGGLIFDTLDFFVANGITPTVELSYMPAALALNSTAYYRHYMGIRSTFASAPQWRAFITGMVQTMISRYGAQTVRSWRFEVWSALAFALLRALGPGPPNPPPPPPPNPYHRRAKLQRPAAGERLLPRVRPKGGVLRPVQGNRPWH